MARTPAAAAFTSKPPPGPPASAARRASSCGVRPIVSRFCSRARSSLAWLTGSDMLGAMNQGERATRRRWAR
jgi:hypothetical protein